MIKFRKISKISIALLVTINTIVFSTIRIFANGDEPVHTVNKLDRKKSNKVQEKIIVKQKLPEETINKKTKKIINNAETEIRKEEKAKRKINLIIEGKVSDDDIKTLKKEINDTIPEWLLDSFIENEWYIILTSKDIAKEYYSGQYKRVMAVTQHKEKRIIIEKRAIKDCVAHEFGHFLDSTCTYPVSNSEEFKKIYKDEEDIFKSKLKNDGCVFNACEFFAEEFHYSRKNPKVCTKKALEYIETISKYYQNGAHI